jgi:hypothetical protein
MGDRMLTNTQTKLLEKEIERIKSKRWELLETEGFRGVNTYIDAFIEGLTWAKKNL